MMDAKPSLASHLLCPRRCRCQSETWESAWKYVANSISFFQICSTRFISNFLLKSNLRVILSNVKGNFVVSHSNVKANIKVVRHM